VRYVLWSDTLARPVSAQNTFRTLHRYPNTPFETRARDGLTAESVGVEIAAGSEEFEKNEMSECSLDITCSTATQSASSPSEPDLENGRQPEITELLSDCSTVSAENGSSTASAASCSELELVSSSQPRTRTKKKSTIVRDGALSSAVLTGTENSDKDQIVISASNRVQNYLASLGLPGIFVSV